MTDPLEEDAAPIDEVTGAFQRGFQPGRWWKAIDVHGNLLAETSRPSDFVDLGLTDRSDVRFYHQYFRMDNEWIRETPVPKTIKE